VECTFGILANKRRIHHRFVTASLKLVAFYTIMYGKIIAFLFDESLYENPLESVQPVGIRVSVRDIA